MDRMTDTTGTTGTNGTDEGAGYDVDAHDLPIDPVDRVLARAESRTGAHVFGAAQALQDGADFLVVGRPILAAADPRAAALAILEEMEGK